MSEASVRQRNSKSAPTTKNTFTASTVEGPDEAEDAGRLISILDIFRIVLTSCVVSCALSYYTTSGESVFWGYRPWVTRPHVLKAYLNGPLNLTPAQLSEYDGSVAGLPIYLAINGSIFDVSAGRHSYGPGGGYNVFAGRDATRAFVTGCFLEDRTDDMRGAELMYVPVEDEEETISNAEKKIRAEKERREARKKMRKEIKKWEDFYGTSTKYFKVGNVVGEKKKHDGPIPELCEVAQKGRPKRSKMKRDAAA